VMTFEEAEKFKWNPFDLTKVQICCDNLNKHNAQDTKDAL